MSLPFSSDTPAGWVGSPSLPRDELWELFRGDVQSAGREQSGTATKEVQRVGEMHSAVNVALLACDPTTVSEEAGERPICLARVEPGSPPRLARPRAWAPGRCSREVTLLSRAPADPAGSQLPPSPARGRGGSGQRLFLPGEPAEGGPALLPVPPTEARARRPLDAGSPGAAWANLSRSHPGEFKRTRCARPCLVARRTGKVSARPGNRGPGCRRDWIWTLAGNARLRGPSTVARAQARGARDPRGAGRTQYPGRICAESGRLLQLLTFCLTFPGLEKRDSRGKGLCNLRTPSTAFFSVLSTDLTLQVPLPLAAMTSLPATPSPGELMTTPVLQVHETLSPQAEEASTALIAVVITVVFLTLLSVVTLIFFYLYKNKGSYVTYEPAEGGEPSAVLQMESDSPKGREKEEYFI
ncbi:small cell adhesion glycoprotein [Sigmodon hispidus]